ncbi:hypothetical protein [Pseudomonas viridiflava]|uniref:hypothetical protein n=1 Tax=Pseudomonas viridiflava TaxID=33069 RepID=UPI0010FABD8B|nr:hypothetical protein [Pseudomonas viridiflava]
MTKANTVFGINIDDIKSLFDGIKNIAVCASLAIGLSYLQAPLEEMGVGYTGRALINWILAAIIGGLTFFALLWIWLNLKTTPTNKTFNAFSFFALAAIAVAAFFAVFLHSHSEVAFKVW